MHDTEIDRLKWAGEVWWKTMFLLLALLRQQTFELNKEEKKVSLIDIVLTSTLSGKKKKHLNYILTLQIVLFVDLIR